MMKLELWNNKIKKSKLPVVVEFWAKWCGPCKMMSPALETIKKEFAGKVELIKIDADSEPELLRALKVYSIPTVFVYHEGNLISRKSGAMNLDQIRKMFIMAVDGQKSKNGLNSTDRVVRLAAGTGLLAAAYFTGNTVALYILAGLVLFSAVYDRCPIWKLVSSKVAGLFQRRQPEQNS